MILEWSVFALADRDQIFDYIEADNPSAAIAVDERIQEHVEMLVRFPLSGRVGRVGAVAADTMRACEVCSRRCSLVVLKRDRNCS